jgi:hypothetical protein
MRLRAPTLDFYVDVRVREFGGRCIAAADIAGDAELGFGFTIREAVNSALATLGPAAAALAEASFDEAAD